MIVRTATGISKSSSNPQLLVCCFCLSAKAVLGVDVDCSIPLTVCLQCWWMFVQYAVIHMTPYDKKSWFNNNIKSVFSGGFGASNATALLLSLKKSMIRHTKAQVLGGQAVLQLPKKTEELVPSKWMFSAGLWPCCVCMYV